MNSDVYIHLKIYVLNIFKCINIYLMLNANIDSSKYLIYICVISILLLVVFSVLYWTLPDGMMVKVGNYIQVVTVFILVITSMISIMTFKYQLDERTRTAAIQYATITQNEINDIDKLFMTNPLLDRLYFEMYSHVPHIQRIKNMQNTLNETPDRLKQEQHMANIIFQKIADIYFCEQLDNSTLENTIEWINTFKGWMKSPILLSHWEYLKFEHHPSVRVFVDNVLIRQNQYIK